MKTMSVSEARSRLPAVIDEVVKTREQALVTRYGRPLVTIAPVAATVTKAKAYPLRDHRITVADDFDAPLPDLWRTLAVAEERGEYRTKKRRSKSKHDTRHPGNSTEGSP